MVKLVLALIILVGAVYALPMVEETSTACKEEGSLSAHPDCTKFYSCVNGVKLAQDCPPSTYFNPRKLLCDFPAQVPECKGGTRPPEGSTIAPPETTPWDDFTTSTDEPDLSSIPDEPTTPEEVATTEEEIDTTDEPVPTTSNSEAPSTTTTAPEESTDAEPTTEDDIDPTTTRSICAEGGIYFETDPSNCSNYHICVNSESQGVVTCPPETFFDPSVCACNLADLVIGCSEPICKDGEVKFKPIPENCSAYIFCVNGNSTILHCPEGTLFDPVLLNCNKKELVKCEGSFEETDPIFTFDREGQTCFPSAGTFLEKYFH
ncbi:unnamed protein product [Allacma fusca]|uniref:Chitin-binding type-2 domain-containing protein n=1 Tax=Allacma fusca TaxID=39272 RepID=A0A8J2PWW3_9HEXA|nr:unnamed protein product [Allacma fusca]